MSHGYQGYGGNPYDQGPGAEGGYVTNTTSDYYQAGYSAPQQYPQQAPAYYGDQSYGPAAQTGPYDRPPGGEPAVVRVQAPRTTLSNQDFLSRCDAIRGQIRELTSNIGEIGSVHQRLLTSPDASHAQLDNLVANTQILNTKIKDQIRVLEADTLQSGDNTTKRSQIRTLKSQFRAQLEDYQKEEQAYRKRYQDQIAREYKIVNPDASESEVREAATADWGNDGVFQTALKSNRTGAASSALSQVRTRHHEIQNIEKTLLELAQMFQDLAAQVELQEAPVAMAEEQAHETLVNTQQGNAQLSQAKDHAARARKLKWIVFWVIVFIVVVVAAVIGAYFGVQAHRKSS